MTAKLSFFARGTAMCPRFDQPTKRGFVGRKFDADIGGWPKVREPVVVVAGSDAATECVLAVVRGDLWPADEATADACGVKFDPKFGGDVELKPAPSSASTASAITKD